MEPSSKPGERLNADYRAMDVENPDIRQVVSESLEERARVKDRIARLSVLMDDLRLQMRKIEERIRAHRTLICEIHTLPVEVIQVIFRWCLPPRNSAMSSKEAPLLLGRVCRAWRELSLSTPELWSSLHIHAPSRHFRAARDYDSFLVRYGEAVIDWLDRSASLALSISFADEGPDEAESTISPSHYLLDILFRFSHRWNHLNVNACCESLGRFARLTEADVPLLQTVQLQVTDFSADVFMSASLSFLRSPSIDRVSVWNHGMPPQLSALPLRWDLLTFLSFTSRPDGFTYLTLEDALVILRGCSRIAVCVLEISSGMTLTTPLQTLHLPLLRELRVNFSMQVPEDRLVHFFKILDAPELRHLELKRAIMTDYTFMSLLLTHPREIDTMSFDVGIITVGDLVGCLCVVTPTLRRFFLSLNPDVRGPSPNILAPFTPTLSSGEIMCPFLEEVDIRFPYNSEVTDDDILQFILSRTTLAPPGVARLKSVKFRLRRAAERDLHQELRPLVEMGLKLQLQYEGTMFLPFEKIEISDSYDGWAPRYAWFDSSPSPVTTGAV